jgi:hypothetical protein
MDGHEIESQQCCGTFPGDFVFHPLNPSWRNWFRKSQLTSMVALGLRKPYAQTKAGESGTCAVFIDSVDGS